MNVEHSIGQESMPAGGLNRTGAGGTGWPAAFFAGSDVWRGAGAHPAMMMFLIVVLLHCAIITGAIYHPISPIGAFDNQGQSIRTQPAASAAQPPRSIPHCARRCIDKVCQLVVVLPPVYAAGAYRALIFIR